jgi:hypothetical protein
VEYRHQPPVWFSGWRMPFFGGGGSGGPPSATIVTVGWGTNAEEWLTGTVSESTIRLSGNATEPLALVLKKSSVHGTRTNSRGSPCSTISRPTGRFCLT